MNSFKCNPYQLHAYDFCITPSVCNHQSSLQTWVNDWCRSVATVNEVGTSKLSSCRKKVTEICRSVISLEETLKQSESMKSHASDDEWSSSVQEFLYQKEKLDHLLNEATSLSASLGTQSRKGWKRKLRRKAKKVEEQLRLKKQRKKTEEKHRKIDEWMEKKKRDVEESKRQEDLANKADLVFSSVKAKQTEAKRILGLLTTLEKLRTLRAVDSSKGPNSGGFQTVIDKLRGHWLERMKEYKLEEKGLKVILDTTESSAKKEVKGTPNAKFMKNWFKHILGANYTGASQNVSLTNRVEWDRFAGATGFMSSSIPVGWVIPTAPGSEEWAKLLKQA